MEDFWNDTDRGRRKYETFPMPLCSSQIHPFLYHFVFLCISKVREREVALGCRQATI